MPPMSMMIKPVSGSCNMRCHYCFYSDVANHREMRNYGKMDSDTMRTLIRKAFIYAEGNVSFAFQGGEPTLAGIDFFREFVRNVSQCNTRHIPVSFAVQTNGYDLSDELCQFFADHHFLAGVSVDGAKEIHNALRPDSAGAGSYDQVMTGIEKLKHHGVEYNILCVVTAPIAAQGKRVWQELKRHQYLQFIPCIDEFGGMLHDYSLTPEAYGQFLIDTFSCYAEDYASGHPVSERRFDNYLSILLGQQPELCGMRGMCGLYFLAEADGSIYPCDFYVLDEWKLGNVKSDSFFKMEKSAASRKFRSISLQLPDTCKKCIWLNLCHGGCRRDREPIINSHGSENKFCKSYYMFFEACLPQMQKMAERISHHLKYYVEGNHEAIIHPDVFEMVQREIERRGKGKKYHSGVHAFSTKIKCGECGCWYGSKVWHSNSKYKRTIWRCNHKYDGDHTCQTPHLTDEEIQAAFLRAANKLLATKTAVIANGRAMVEVLFSTAALEAEHDELLQETQVVSDLVQQCIYENAHVAQDQTEYQKRYDALTQRFEKAKSRLEAVAEEIHQRQTQRANYEAFLKAFEKLPDQLTEFALETWHSLVDFATVYSENDIRFTFKNGQEVRA